MPPSSQIRTHVIVILHGQFGRGYTEIPVRVGWGSVLEGMLRLFGAGLYEVGLSGGVLQGDLGDGHD